MPRIMVERAQNVVSSIARLDPCKGGDKKDKMEDDGKVHLRRDKGLLSGISLIMGTMIGSGIFISPKGMLEGCGSVGLTLILWCLCGVLTTMGALVYAELGTLIPKCGGEHAYLMHTFVKEDGKQAGDKTDIEYKALGSINGKRQESRSLARLPAFLFDWVALFIIRPTMFAIMTMALGTYAAKPFFPDCDPPAILVKIITATAMCVIAYINSYSARASTVIQNVTTGTKLIALAVVSIGGLVKLFEGNTESFEDSFEGTSTDAATVAIAFYNGLWAFDGWNGLNYVTEELKSPSKNLPRAIMIGIPMTTVCYIMANIGYLAVMSKGEIMLSHAVAVTWGDRVLGVMSWLIPIFVIVSTFGSSNGCLYSSGRLCYSIGRDGHFPQVVSFLQFERMTPMPAIFFTLCVSLFLIIPADLSTLIDIFSFSSWMFYGVTTMCLLILRFTEPDTPRPYKVPLPVPIIVVCACIYLVITPVLNNPGMQFVYAFFFFLCGIVVYIPFIYYRKQFPFMDKVTRVLQKLMKIAPVDS